MPLSPLVIIQTNTQVTQLTVRLADLWDDLWPATYVPLDAGDFQNIVAQIRPVAEHCACTNPADGEFEVIIIDPGSVVIKTIGSKNMCQLLQRFPQLVLQNNKLLNGKVNELKEFEECGTNSPLALAN